MSFHLFLRLLHCQEFDVNTNKPFFLRMMTFHSRVPHPSVCLSKPSVCLSVCLFFLSTEIEADLAAMKVRVEIESVTTHLQEETEEEEEEREVEVADRMPILLRRLPLPLLQRQIAITIITVQIVVAAVAVAVITAAAAVTILILLLPLLRLILRRLHIIVKLEEREAAQEVDHETEETDGLVMTGEEASAPLILIVLPPLLL